MAAPVVGKGIILEATHADPVWRNRSDFIIATPIDASDTEVETEQLWARRLGANRFEICCIPFFAYNLALGDVVETSPDFMVDRVVRPSGRYVFRVFFPDSAFSKTTATSELQALGGLMEWSSSDLLAVDAPDVTRAQSIADYLHSHAVRSHLVYETGRTT